jgi:hypothetical protein
MDYNVQTFITSFVLLHLKKIQMCEGAMNFTILIFIYSNTYYSNSDKWNVFKELHCFQNNFFYD